MMNTMGLLSRAVLATVSLSFLLVVDQADSFVVQPCQRPVDRRLSSSTSSASSLLLSSSSSLRMANLDPITSLRTEWVSAALCTNQTPRSADVCVQLGTQDGRAVSFLPRTIRELVTSSAESDGELSVRIQRQLEQQKKQRQSSVVLTTKDQRADALTQVANESVDVVISLQAVPRMLETGLNWKTSVQEAARVLKPGGRLLFVEPTDIAGENYVEYLYQLLEERSELEDEEQERLPFFEDVGFDEIDLVLVPHIAGVAIKSEQAAMTPSELAAQAQAAEQDRLADLSLAAFERGLKKRKRKRKAKKGAAEEDA